MPRVPAPIRKFNINDLVNGKDEQKMGRGNID